MTGTNVLNKNIRQSHCNTFFLRLVFITKELHVYNKILEVLE